LIYRQTNLPFGADFNECNLGLGTAFAGTDLGVPFWQAGFEGHSPFSMMTVALAAATQNDKQFALATI